MPLAPQLSALVTRRRFWTDAYWLSFTELDDEAAPDRIEVWFSITDRHRLLLTFTADLDRFDLSLSVDGGIPDQLGWDDQAHFHPHVLRWTELDGIGHAIAERDSTLAHPGVPLLLLSRFAPITNDADARLARDLTNRAWDRLGLLTERERTAVFDKLDKRGSGFVWSSSERGLVLTQSDEGPRFRAIAYTLRSSSSGSSSAESNQEFPHAELAEMLALCSRESSVAEHVDPPAPLSSLTFELAVAPELPSVAARFVTQFVNRALADSADGSANVYGSTSQRDGTVTSNFVMISGRLSANQLAAQTLSLLRIAGALPFTRLHGVDVGVDVGLGESPPIRARTHLQLMNLVIARGTSWSRFDRPPLTRDQLGLLARTLDQHQFSAPDDRDRRFALGPSGERIELVLAPADTDGLSVWLDELSPWAVGVVHALAAAASLFVYPPLVAPTAALARDVDAPWPTVRVAESGSDLYEFIS